MENASKALIMAASVLIALMILAIGIFLFNEYGQLGSIYSSKMSEQEQKNTETSPFGIIYVAP